MSDTPEGNICKLSADLGWAAETLHNVDKKLIQMSKEAKKLQQELNEVKHSNGITFLMAEKHALENELEAMTAKAIGWQKQAELDAKLLVECREKAERYRLEANAMMAQRSEAREALKRITECDMRWSKKIARDALEAAK